MNFDDYEIHIIQKHRMAVAIAVLKTKPKDKSLDEHITDLKNKFNNENNVLDITICSDDFNMGDNLSNENDFNDTANINVGDEVILINENYFNDAANINMGDIIHENGFNDTANINKGDEVILINENDFNDTANSVTILKDFDMNGDINIAGEMNEGNRDKTACDLTDVIRSLNNVDSEIESNTNQTQSTYCEGTQPSTDYTVTIERESWTDTDKTFYNSLIHRERESESAVNRNKSSDSINYTLNQDNTFDSQATEIYTLHGFTQNSQNYTHVSQSQVCNIDVSDKFVTRKLPRKDKVQQIKNLNENIEVLSAKAHKVSGLNGNDVAINKNDKESNSRNFNICIQVDNALHTRKVNIQKDKHAENVPNVSMEVDVLEIYSQDGQDVYTNDLTPNNKVSDDSKTKRDVNQTMGHGFTRNFTENAKQDGQNLIQAKLTDLNNCLSGKIESACTEVHILSQNAFNEDNKIVPQIHTLSNFNKNSNIKNIDNKTMQIIFTDSLGQNAENITHQQTQMEIQESNILLEDSEEFTAELVPFKVVEELNKVRSYLCKRERSYDGSSDSGYRSDSQGRTTKSAMQLSDNWLNQSAHCLYDYITICQLVVSTHEITEDISLILSKLIDRLHEEEIYPPFLEELLDYIDAMVENVFSGENTLLEKDEYIQRLHLLNKSTHIQKYTIEKITTLLQNIHTKLTNNNDLYELTNIIEMENVAYVFHLLEITIKKYIKSKNGVDDSQCQTSSQENDKSLKRSAITDIWRKKWNPEYKNCKVEGSCEKKCVFTKCSEVLNKIVVAGMDGYGLVAFAALQCFNLLQS